MLQLDRDHIIPFYGRMNLSASPANDQQSYWVFWQSQAPSSTRLFFPRTKSVHLELSDKAYFVLEALSQMEQLNSRAICNCYNEAHPDKELRHSEVVEAVSQLYAHGFLVPTDVGRRKGFAIIEPEPDRDRPLWRRVFSIRVALFNPDRLLSWIDGKFGSFLFSKMFNRCLLVWAFFVSIAVLSNIDRLRGEWSMLYESYLPTHIALVYGWLFLGKLVHELGHGLAIKHHGREVPEMGIQLIFFTPFPYCESQNARGLCRRSEMIIAGIGVYSEVMMASVFAFLWLHSEFEESAFLYLTMMLTLSVNTLLFNGNPLTMFDSYHVLSQGLGYSEHMRERALQALSFRARQVIFGLGPQSEEERSSGLFLPCFGLAVMVYRFFLVFGICAFLAHALDPYGLGSFFGALAMWSLIILPGYQLALWFIRGLLKMLGVQAGAKREAASDPGYELLGLG